MTSRILTALATIALPGTAWAHPGHIADLGQGHAHWMIYWLGAGAAVGLALWTATKVVTRKHAR